jgi:hypothetical protein
MAVRLNASEGDEYSNERAFKSQVVCCSIKFKSVNKHAQLNWKIMPALFAQSAALKGAITDAEHSQIYSTSYQ